MQRFEQAWLTYLPQKGQTPPPWFHWLWNEWPETDSPCAASAAGELARFARKRWGIGLKPAQDDRQPCIHFVCRADDPRNPETTVGTEGYTLREENGRVTVAAATSQGLLYGCHALIRRVATGAALQNLSITERPAAPLRMLDHWDNIDGSIERGYAGTSFFFRKGKVLCGPRTQTYARLCASVGINAVCLNNVNVGGGAEWLISARHYPQLQKVQKIFTAQGIRLFLCVDFAAPIDLGGLPTADPAEPAVQRWWQNKAGEVWAALPGFGGFVVKADSEGRPGPHTYGRTQAEGANLLAAAVKPFGGLVIWRCFVYNCRQDWRDRVTDRAKAGYDTFAPLEGTFAGNVVLQVKNGPVDFQVREPVSPLFGAMPHTNQMLEVQAAQEYTGQQRHVCYLVPMWKEVLRFSTGCGQTADTVADIITGKAFGQTLCGITAVANTGSDPNWTGHDLAAANWYGFGRLGWNPNLSAEQIAREWVALCYGTDPTVTEIVTSLLLRSWPVYESYTAPLGIGWMVNPNNHYGPSVDGYEYDRWGTYHRADCHGLGVERGQTGTGYAQQYFPANAALYDDPATCPEELLLFFHRVAYTHRLKSGKTLIQHIYDTHFDGAAAAAAFCEQWQTLEGLIPEPIYTRTLHRLEEQRQSAIEWRDRINTYFYRMSGTPDEQGRIIY